MKKTIPLLLLALLASTSSFAKDERESTVGLSMQNGATSATFDVANEKNDNVIGVRGVLPLNQTARAVEAMNKRWSTTSPKSNVELYGVIDVGYSGTFN